MRRVHRADRNERIGRRTFLERSLSVCAPAFLARSDDGRDPILGIGDVAVERSGRREPALLLNYDDTTPREALTKDWTRGEAVWPLRVTWRDDSLAGAELEFVLTGRRTGATTRLPASGPVSFSPAAEGLAADIYDILVLARRERRAFRFPWHFSAYGTPAIPELRFGVCQSIPAPAGPAEVERLISVMQDLHVEAVRTDFLWQLIEPRDGVYAFADYDAIASGITSAGIGILATLGYGTRWSNANNDDETQFYPPDDPLAYQDYVARTVEHFSGVISIWELWNEPNVQFFWRPEPSSKADLELLRAGFIGVKYEDPGATVVLGGLTGNGLNAIVQHGVPQDFLKDLYAYDGARWFDVLNVHPYYHPYDGIPGLESMLEGTRRVATEYGDRDKPLWITEIGWPRELAGSEAHASWVKNVYSLNLPTFWYNLRDRPGDWYNFGLVSADYSPEPAYYAYKEMARARG
jgi:hypothetical protein